MVEQEPFILSYFARLGLLVQEIACAYSILTQKKKQNFKYVCTMFPQLMDYKSKSPSTVLKALVVVIRRDHTKRRIGAHGCGQFTFSMEPTF